MKTNYLTPVQIKTLLDELNFVPRKKYGQNFVVDSNIIRKIVRLAEIDSKATVLEIGPGLGSLTLGLLANKAKVVAVEIDTILARQLPKTISNINREMLSRLTVLNKDALILQPSDLVIRPNILVANLPYNIAVPLILNILTNFPTITKILVMVQLEVAERITALPGSKIYGVPTVKIGYYAKSRLITQVSKTVFWPIPKVTSAIVELIRKDNVEPDFSLRNLTFKLIDVAFTYRRKMLKTSLLKYFPCLSSEIVIEILKKSNIIATARAEELTVIDFLNLANNYTNWLKIRKYDL